MEEQVSFAQSATKLQTNYQNGYTDPFTESDIADEATREDMYNLLRSFYKYGNVMDDPEGLIAKNFGERLYSHI